MARGHRVTETVALSALALLITACGSSSSSNQATSHAKTTSGGPAPSNLVGTYRTTLKRGDLPPTRRGS